MNFSVANHNTTSPKGFKHYTDVEFKDIPEMVTAGFAYCACKLKDEYRKDDNYEGMEDVIILDIDDGCSIEQAKKIFEKYEFYLITTKSHQKDKGGIVCDRFRIFLHLDKTLSSSKERQELIDYVYEIYPFVDQSCRNRSRYYYSSL